MSILQVAQPKDHPTVLDLIQAYYQYDGLEFDPSSIHKSLDLLLTHPEFGQVFLIQQEDKAIGYTILTYAFDLEFGGRQAFITDLFIQSEHRGKGLGQQVMEELEQFAKAKGLSALELQVEKHNASAQSFFQKLGFKTHQRIPMSKTLDDERPTTNA